jgi:uncharacterized repeat protein (TIGR01451 family)
MLLFVALCFAGFAPQSAQAQDTVCARVKIQILQSLTLERQAFDATMKINNTTDSGVIENVAVAVKVTDENGTPVAVTSNPNDLSGSFFLTLFSKQNIDAVDGTGAVQPQSSAIIDWQLIPSPGSAGSTPLGKKYWVGATLTYRFNGVDTVLEVSPDVITVKPMPLLTLDYFLPQDVWGDDPLTPAVEPIEPFTLGVRVKNSGYGDANNLQIDSAQPKIVENNQGLLIDFKIIGSYANDAPVQDGLKINFGNVTAGASAMGRWIMETTLAGKFTEFTATFSHSDALGGALTSLFQGTATHFLIHDVRVDLPGRDAVRDFLANDGSVIRVYESDSADTEVTDRSGAAVLAAGINAAGAASYRLSFPATAGFVYVKLPDPFNGQRVLGKTVRSDAKLLGTENIWLSKTRNAQTKQVQYWVNFFDANSTGLYDAQFAVPPAAAHPPVIQFIPDRTTQEQQQVSFLVEASSPDGKPVTLTADALPAGASLTAQATDPASPGVSRAIFDWTPARSTAGDYLIVYRASDGTLNTSSSATLHVQASAAGSVAPAAGNDSATTRKTVNLTLAVLANDSLAANSAGFNPATLDLDPATATVDATRTLPGMGTFTANPSGTVGFAPLPSFTGVSTITYRIQDHLGQAANPANLTVTVTGPGNPGGDTATDGPVANPDPGTTPLNAPITLDVKLNDIAGPGQTLNLHSVDLDTGTDGVQPARTTGAGAWKSNGDGTVTFSPATGYSGLATLAYALADSAGKTAQSAITVAVTGGATPLAQNDSAATQPTVPVNLAILDNDTPSAGQVLVPGKVDLDPSTPNQLDGTVTTAEGSWTANAHGILSFVPTGSYKTTHQPFTGSTPPLAYTVADSGGQLASASISIAVNPTAAPTAASASASTAFNTPVKLDPAGKGTASPGATLDPTTLDLDPTTAAVEQSLSTTDGTWTVNADGTVGFAPAFNYTGTTAAQPYLIRDSLGHSANAYLTVTVALPAAVPVSGTVFQDSNLDQVQGGGERGTDAGGALYLTAVNAGFAVATAPVAEDGSYTLALTPAASYTLVLSANPQGSTTASLPTGWGNTGENTNGTPVGVIDGTLHLDLGVATLTGQNFGITQGPHAANDSAGTAYATALNGTVAGNDLYPNGSVFTKMAGPSHGTASVNPDGSYAYAPASGFSGTDRFAYQLCLPSPNGNLCATATVTIAVAAQIIPPDLRIQQTTSASQPAVGQPFSYTLTISNSGGPTTGLAQVTDLLPSGIKLTQIQAATGWDCAPAVSTASPLQGGNGATLVCNHADPLPVGSQTLTLTAVPTASGARTNQATITGDGQTPDTANCKGTALANCDDAQVNPTNPALALVNTVALPPASEIVRMDGQAQAGEALAYAFTLSNRGDTNLTPVALADTQIDANSLVCDTLTDQHNPFSLSGLDSLLRPNESANCTGKHTVTPVEASVGRIDNTALATGKAADGTTVQAVSTGLWDNTPPQGQIDLVQTAIHQDANANGRFDVGETVGFTFIVRNTGTVTLDKLKVAATLLPNPDYSIDCLLATLPVGEPTICTASPDYSLTLADVAAGKLVSHAVATASDSSNTPVADGDTRELDSGETAALALVKTATLPMDQGLVGLSVGDTLAYTVVATNTGATALTNVTVTDDKLGSALGAANACLPALGSTLNPGAQMVCTANHALLEGETNPVANTAKATGKPLGRAAAVNAASYQVVPYLQPPLPTLYSVGGLVWLDANNNGLYEPALGETGINGIMLHLLLCDTNGTACAPAVDANGAAIADRATAGGGAYQFTDVPGNPAGKRYQVQVLPVNFLSQSFGTRPLFGKVSSQADDAAALPWTNHSDQGIGITPSPADGILSRAFDLRPLATTALGNVDFGFVVNAAPAVPDIELTLTATPAAVAPGGALTFTVQADNAVGAGTVTGKTIMLDNLPAGMTVKPGWPAVQPAGWQCQVTAARNQVACSYTGPLPLAGGSSLGAAIPIPVVAPKTGGILTNTVTITKLPKEISYTNNSASASVKVGP